eukprot:750782-Amphidinium_carterae.1
MASLYQPGVMCHQNTTSLEVGNCCYECFHGLNVQVVCGLVQDDDVGLGKHECCECYSGLTCKRRTRGIEL